MSSHVWGLCGDVYGICGKECLGNKSPAKPALKCWFIWQGCVSLLGKRFRKVISNVALRLVNCGSAIIDIEFAVDTLGMCADSAQAITSSRAISGPESSVLNNRRTSSSRWLIGSIRDCEAGVWGEAIRPSSSMAPLQMLLVACL